MKTGDVSLTKFQEVWHLKLIIINILYICYIYETTIFLSIRKY